MIVGNALQRISRTISNEFFNYQMKRINELLVKDRDAESKRIKREKSGLD